MRKRVVLRLLGWGALAVTAIAISRNAVQTVNYAAHPEYTFVKAARQLTAYIDQHPNGNRLLVSISGDEITLITHVQVAMRRLQHAHAGVFLTWERSWRFTSPAGGPPGTTSILGRSRIFTPIIRWNRWRQFRAFDDPERNVLVLFKLHPLPGGQVRLIDGDNLQEPLPEDKIYIPLE